MNYKQRMLKELLELKERIVKLDCYDKKVQTEQELMLMERQRKAMQEYLNALEERIMLILEDKNSMCVDSARTILEPGIALLSD